MLILELLFVLKLFSFFSYNKLGVKWKIMNTIYFDNAATTKIKSEVFNEMLPYLSTNYGNASSLYKIGKISKTLLKNLENKLLL